MTRVTAAESAIAALQASHNKVSVGMAPTPALALGATATVQVPIVPAMPNTTYTASATISGGTNVLANLSVQSTTVVSASRVDVVVKANGILSLGAGQVLVVASKT